MRQNAQINCGVFVGAESINASNADSVRNASRGGGGYLNYPEPSEIPPDALNLMAKGRGCWLGRRRSAFRLSAYLK